MTSPSGPAARSPKRAGSPGGAERLGRADRSTLSRWFWEIDRVLLVLLAILITIGMIAVAAASPVGAARLSTATETVSPLYYFWRHLFFVALAIPLMLWISTLPRDQVRRWSIYGAGVFLFLLTLVPFVGTEINGAERWLGSGALRLQPSEFFKPFYIVAIAWMLSLKAEDPGLPVVPVTAAITALVAVLLMQQPDLGQTIIICGSWMVLLIITGLSFRIVGGLAAAGLGGIIAAYFLYPVATNRIDIWLFGEGDDFQVVKAHDTLTSGGWFGTGPGAGVAKFRLPEAHTDYIFSVIGEEFGLVACAAIACLFLAIIIRVLVRLLDEQDSFVILAVAGLVTQFGGQAIVNMAVNTQIFPSKGMTLPFISYGGSSMLALAIGMGLLLSLTRRNPYLGRSTFDSDWTNR